MKTLRVAIEGCCHGDLQKIYNGIPSSTELLLICGDFQALRSTSDYQALNVPEKYRRLGDFQSYYTGKKKAPVLTIFVGGNHESSSYLQELKYGGWVAPNIYYLGEFGGVHYKGLSICGWSGIYNPHTYMNRPFNVEKLPFDSSSIRSVYHQKLPNFLKMYLMKDINVVLSHDWPVGIEQYGDKEKLLKQKPYFAQDVKKGQLGSPLNKVLLHHLKPQYWFSGHLHVKFEANVNHNKPEPKPVKNVNEISLDMDSSDEASDDDSQEHKKVKPNAHVEHDTHFLALDKYGPRRSYFKVIDVPISENRSHPSVDSEELYYDKQAIAINRVVERYATDHKAEFELIDPREVLRNQKKFEKFIPLVAKELEKLDQLDDGSFKIPRNFEVVAPADHEGDLKYFPNNQTEVYCRKFGIPPPDL
ncbi:DBR1 [Candida margitis]|uniref:DBR1 n=1 Tax=Candida margitis TaxID=1775924 RepID=UPI002225FC7D|nr:DBR1 [Candida margitis]KAI5970027.1 DBR1 [Candida margitis]